MSTNNELCPCGSGKTYSECCEPIIKGKTKAPSAEACMRARYTSYVKHEIDYIINSCEEGEGIGEIEKEPKCDKITLSYDGEKPTVRLEGFEPPVGKMQNLKTLCTFYATNQSELKDGAVDWNTNNAILWMCGYSIPGAVDEFVWDDSAYWDSRTFKQIFDATGKDTIYASWEIQFDVPKSSGTSWKIDFMGGLLKIR